MKHTPEKNTAWLPTVEEILFFDHTEILPAIDEVEADMAPARPDARTRELRWFVDLHLVSCGCDLTKLADYAMFVGLYPLSATRSEVIRTLRNVTARMDEVAA